jgi:hypothetical protein
LIGHWRPVAAVFAATIVVNVLLHLFVVREDVRMSGDREAILAAERARLASLNRDISTLEHTVSKVACVRSDERHVFDELLSGKSSRMTAVLRELSQLAKEMRVEPGRLTFSQLLVEDSGLVRFAASFSFEAPYLTLHEFIERIEASPNFLFIEQVGLDGGRGQGGDLRLQIRVATWFQGPDLERLNATFRGAGS